MRKISLLLLALLLCCSIVQAKSLSSAPDENLVGLNAADTSIAALHDGKPLYLNFWASWCPPCRGELPEFNEMDQDFKKSGEAVLLAVNMTDGQRDTKSKVQKFINDEKYGIRVLLDEKGEAAAAYGIQYLPTTYVIDAKGMVRGQLVGGTTKAAVMKLVNEAKK